MVSYWASVAVPGPALNQPRVSVMCLLCFSYVSSVRMPYVIRKLSVYSDCEIYGWRTNHRQGLLYEYVREIIIVIQALTYYINVGELSTIFMWTKTTYVHTEM